MATQTNAQSRDGVTTPNVEKADSAVASTAPTSNDNDTQHTTRDNGQTPASAHATGVTQQKRTNSDQAQQSSAGGGPRCNLYVGCIPLHWSESELAACFAPFGTVASVRILLDANRQSRGAGFVHFTTPTGAMAAISGLHGAALPDADVDPSGAPRLLQVKFAYDKGERGERHDRDHGGGGMGKLENGFGRMHLGGGGGGGPSRTSNGHGSHAAGGAGGPNADDAPVTNVYCAGLPHEYTRSSVEHLFAPYGRISQVKILTDPVTGMSRGLAFVKFDRRADAARAIAELDGTTCDGGDAPIQVRWARERVQHGGGGGGGGGGGPRGRGYDHGAYFPYGGQHAFPFMPPYGHMPPGGPGGMHAGDMMGGYGAPAHFMPPFMSPPPPPHHPQQQGYFDPAAAQAYAQMAYMQQQQQQQWPMAPYMDGPHGGGFYYPPNGAMPPPPSVLQSPTQPVVAAPGPVVPQISNAPIQLDVASTIPPPAPNGGVAAASTLPNGPPSMQQQPFYPPHMYFAPMMMQPTPPQQQQQQQQQQQSQPPHIPPQP